VIWLTAQKDFTEYCHCRCLKT